jgi:aryl-alcohol dehydrogenase-like predicted oxidoreductase
MPVTTNPPTPIARIGLGLAALGRPGYINLGHAADLERDYDRGAMEHRAHVVLDAAYAGGIRYFDAARSYGLAEDFLGSWLSSREIAPGSVTVGSKWGYAYTAGWRVEAAAHEVKEHSLAQLQRQITESRARLGRHLALYQIHSVTPDSPVLGDEGVLAALAGLRADGLRIGLTVSGPSQAEIMRRALDLRRNGARVFDSVQATWNLLERAAEPALREAHRAGVDVIVKEALANGRLTERNAAPGFAQRLSVLRGEAARLGTTVDALALAAALQQPWVTIVLSGATTVEQLRSNLGAVSVAWTPEIAEHLRVLMMDSAAYWQERSALDWN